MGVVLKKVTMSQPGADSIELTQNEMERSEIWVYLCSDETNIYAVKDSNIIYNSAEDAVVADISSKKLKEKIGKVV